MDIMRKWIERIFSQADKSKKSPPALHHGTLRLSVAEKDQGMHISLVVGSH